MKNQILHVFPRFSSFWENHYNIGELVSGWEEFDIYVAEKGVKEADDEYKFHIGLCVDTKGYYRTWEKTPAQWKGEMKDFMDGNEIAYRIYYCDNGGGPNYFSPEEFETLLNAKTFSSVGLTVMHPSEGGVTPALLEEIAADFAENFLSFGLKIAYNEIPSYNQVLAKSRVNPLSEIGQIVFSDAAIDQLAAQAGSTQEEIRQDLQKQLSLDDEGYIVH